MLARAGLPSILITMTIATITIIAITTIIDTINLMTSINLNNVITSIKFMNVIITDARQGGPPVPVCNLFLLWCYFI